MPEHAPLSADERAELDLLLNLASGYETVAIHCGVAWRLLRDLEAAEACIAELEAQVKGLRVTIEILERHRKDPLVADMSCNATTWKIDPQEIQP